MPVVGPEAKRSARAEQEPPRGSGENRIAENEKTWASRPGFFVPCICRADSKAALLTLKAERYSSNFRYQSGTLSGCFDFVMDGPSIPRNNVTSCESTFSKGYVTINS